MCMTLQLVTLNAICYLSDQSTSDKDTPATLYAYTWTYINNSFYAIGKIRDSEENFTIHNTDTDDEKQRTQQLI